MDEDKKNQSDNVPEPPKQLEEVDEAKGLKEQLASAEKLRDEYLSGWQRAKADFINYKKDELMRLQEIARYGAEDMMRELIVVLDNFDIGLAALEKKGPVEKGVYMIRSKIEDILKKRGLARIDVKPGDPFDPSFAEAIAEGESELPAGTVMEEIEAGYRLGDRLLRPARVRVSKDKNK